MKSSVLLGVLALSACGADETERAAKPKAMIRVPILEEVSGGLRLVHDKHPEVPAFVELTVDGEPFNEVLAQIDVLNEDRRGELVEVVNGGDIGSYEMSKSVRMCYAGEPKKAMKLVASLTDSVISEMFSLHAFRTSGGKFDGDGKKLSKEAEAEIPLPAFWEKFKGAGGAILAITSSNDGGDEFTDTILVRCK